VRFPLFSNPLPDRKWPEKLLGTPGKIPDSQLPMLMLAVYRGFKSKLAGRLRAS
jgi:hypothetical protein